MHGGMFRHGGKISSTIAAQIEGGVASTAAKSRLGLFAHGKTMPYLAPIDHAQGGTAKQPAFARQE